MRKLSLVVTLGALLLLCAGAPLATPAEIPPGSKLAYNFNVIGYPAGKTYDGGCGEGHRIFVNREASNAQMVVHNSSTGWNIVDCNATSDRRALLETSDTGMFDVYVRILGKPGGSISIICDSLVEDAVDGDALCLVDTIDLTRGKKSTFTLAPASFFDASLEDLLWTIGTNADFRIAQFRVYQRPTP